MRKQWDITWTAKRQAKHCGSSVTVGLLRIPLKEMHHQCCWWKCRFFLEADLATPLKCKINVKYNHSAPPSSETLTLHSLPKKNYKRKNAMFIYPSNLNRNNFFSPKISRRSARTSFGLGNAPMYLRSERESRLPEGKPRVSLEEKFPPPRCSISRPWSMCPVRR